MQANPRTVTRKPSGTHSVLSWPHFCIPLCRLACSLPCGSESTPLSQDRESIWPSFRSGLQPHSLNHWGSGLSSIKHAWGLGPLPEKHRVACDLLTYPERWSLLYPNPSSIPGKYYFVIPFSDLKLLVVLCAYCEFLFSQFVAVLFSTCGMWGYWSM